MTFAAPSMTGRSLASAQFAGGRAAAWRRRPANDSQAAATSAKPARGRRYEVKPGNPKNQEEGFCPAMPRGPSPGVGPPEAASARVQTRPSPPTGLPLPLEEPAPLLLGDPLPLDAREQVQQPLVPLAQPLVFLLQPIGLDLQLGHALPKDVDVPGGRSRLGLHRRDPLAAQGGPTAGTTRTGLGPVKGTWQTEQSRPARRARAECRPGSAGLHRLRGRRGAGLPGRSSGPRRGPSAEAERAEARGTAGAQGTPIAAPSAGFLADGRWSNRTRVADAPAENAPGSGARGRRRPSCGGARSRCTTTLVPPVR
jgi:hypothetical protein